MSNPRYRRDVRDDMRAWLLDCFSDEASVESIRLANHVVLIDGIERHYEGGMAQFMADGGYESPLFTESGKPVPMPGGVAAR